MDRPCCNISFICILRNWPKKNPDNKIEWNHSGNSSQLLTLVKNLKVIVDEKEEFLKKLLASAQWTARLHGKFWSSGQVKDLLEWEYFNNNILQFQGVGQSDKTDNYSLFMFCICRVLEQLGRLVQVPACWSYVQNCQSSQRCLQINKEKGCQRCHHLSAQQSISESAQKPHQYRQELFLYRAVCRAKSANCY